MSGETQLSVPQRMASALAGAVATSLLVTPFDVVKTRLQAQEGLHLDGASQCNYCRNWAATYRMPRLNGTVDGIFKLARYEGVATLWSGLQPTVAMAVPSTVLYFTAYDGLKQRLQSALDQTPLWALAPMVAGSTARTATVVAVAPLELVRTQMQAQRTSLGGVLRSLRTQVAEVGVGSLFRGLVPTLFRDVPFSAIYWGGYEAIKHALTPAGLLIGRDGVRPPISEDELLVEDGADTFFRAFTAGAGSGMFAAAVTTPFDVVKTRAQAVLYESPAGGPLRAAGPGAGRQPHSVAAMFATLGQIWREEGARGLFAGGTARIAKVAPACAIMIGSYEYSKAFFSGNA